MVPKDGVLHGGDRLSTTDGDRRELAGKGLWASTCGGSVMLNAEPKLRDLMVNVSVVHSGFSQRRDWRKAVEQLDVRRVSSTSPDDVEVNLRADDNNILEVRVRDFTRLPNPEATLATLVDGLRRNIARGPQSRPVYRYPAPYDLVADPCAAFPADVFTMITDRPTDGLQRDLTSLSETPGRFSNSVGIRCDRAGLVSLSEGIAPDVSVLQDLLSVPDPAAAVAAVREQCSFEKAEALPRPIGDVSCGHFKADGGQVLFHAGRSMVRISLIAAKTDPATTRANLTDGAEAIYARLTPSP
jgi:hypothetical protein